MAEPATPGIRHSPTTTHAEWGAGDPRLLISRDETRSVHHIRADVVHIGSAGDNEVQLADADPIHATIHHDERDEYVLTMHGSGEMNASPEPDSDPAVDGERTEILRTGARFTVGPWTLVYNRDEFADHGRPYGGREGGEFSDQPAQAERPDYRGESDADARNLEVRDG